MERISGHIVDVVNSRIFSGTIEFENGRIVNITEEPQSQNQVIMPGFVDSHVHIEKFVVGADGIRTSCRASWYGGFRQRPS